MSSCFVDFGRKRKQQHQQSHHSGTGASGGGGGEGSGRGGRIRPRPSSARDPTSRSSMVGRNAAGNAGARTEEDAVQVGGRRQNESCVSSTNPSRVVSVYPIPYTSAFDTDYSTSLRGWGKGSPLRFLNYCLGQKKHFLHLFGKLSSCLSTLPPLGSEERAFPHNLSVSSRSPTRSTPGFRGFLDRRCAVDRVSARVGSMYGICLVVV